jgi:Ricin-type beta-trefoil lectin domain-like
MRTFRRSRAVLAMTAVLAGGLAVPAAGQQAVADQPASAVRSPSGVNSPEEAQAANPWFRIKNRASGMCLHVSGASLYNGSAVLQAPCGTSSSGYHQQVQFELIEVDGDQAFYRYRFRHSGKCIHVVGASLDHGANLVQWTCYSGVVGYHQQLRDLPVGQGEWDRRKFRHSGLCMYVRSLSSGEVVEQTICGSGVVGYSQQWDDVPVP